MADFVRPRTLPGFQDFMPERQLARSGLIERVRKVYEGHGFSPLDTPALEYRNTLVGQGEVEKEIYLFEDSDGNEVGLRFDLTVPLARFCSQHRKKLAWPLRLYHVAPVWREEKHKPGRFREFVQFDADIVGEPEVWADVELIAMIHETMRAIGMDDSLIKISHRGILTAMIAKAGLAAETTFGVLRTLDKVERLGWETVRKLLSNRPGDMIEGIDAVPLGLPGTAVDVIEDFLSLESQTGDLPDRLMDFFSGVEQAEKGLADLQAIFGALPSMGVPQDAFALDVSIARGLDYYTGPIFETVLKSAPQMGTLFGGGRYDELIGRFGKQSMPATGASIGVDRVLATMESLGLVDYKPSTAEVFVAVFDPALRNECGVIASEMRAAGINTVMYTGKRKLKHQFQHADDLGVKVVILLGSDEYERGSVQVRSMSGEFSDQAVERKQVEVARGDLAAEVLRALGRSSG